MASSPARILLVEFNRDHTVGGSHQAQYDLARLVDRSRWEPVVVYYQENRFAGLLRDQGVEVHVLEELLDRESRVREEGWLGAKAVDILIRGPLARIRLLRDLRVDLLHLNNSPGLGYDDWLPAARIRRIPCVTFSMGPAPRELGPVADALARRFDRVLTISEYVHRTFLDVGYPPRSLSLAQIGVDVANFRARATRGREAMRRELGIADDRVVACMVGNVREWKGQHVVLEALSRISPEQRKSLLVLFVGAVDPWSEEYAASLHATVQEHGLEDCTSFLGSRADTPDLLAASDFGLHASVFPEPFGLVVVEAMAMGLPVIATSIGGPGDVVTPTTGRTFDPSDPGALAVALTEMVEDADLRRSLGERARLRADDFDAHQMVKAVEGVWSEFLQRGA